MNRWKWFGSRPVLYFAEGADGVGAGAAAGAGGGTGAGGGGGTGAGDAGGVVGADALSNLDFLSAEPADGGAGDGQGAGAGAGGAAEKTRADASKDTATQDAATENEINLAALEEGQPEWLGKIADQAALAEVTKLLDLQKAFGQRFKDAADLEGFFKDLPGGREQVAALQTLSNEVEELDGAIEAGTPEKLATVAERYLGMAKDGGVGLFRAAAQHLAKTNGEGWNQIGGELVNSSLRAAGIGLDFDGLKQTIGELRQAIVNKDADAYGMATGKLIGAPKAAPQADPRLTRAEQEAKTARAAERTANVKVWETNVHKNGEAIEQHIRTEIGKALSVKDGKGRPLIPSSIPAKNREELVGKIIAEVDSQVGADKWLGSQIFNLVGARANDKHNLGADDKAFGKALELSKAAADGVLQAAVKKIVNQWSRDLVANNNEAIARAKGAAGGGAARSDIGKTGGGTARSNNKISEQEFQEMDNITFLNDPRGNRDVRRASR